MNKQLVPEANELSKAAKGGTELMLERLYSSVDEKLLSHFQIIPSRVRELDNEKLRILWLHDLPGDKESQHLANDGWKKFHKLVFVSHWQAYAYMTYYRIPPSACRVIRNAIYPSKMPIYKPDDKIRIIYHTTPHRGLKILIKVFEKLTENPQFGRNLQLDVFSSFSLYGWHDRDAEFQPLYERIKSHPQAIYHGAKSNEHVRRFVDSAHIFAYPSIWPETSCISLMEAMSAGCICVHPDFAALPETAATHTLMYPMHEDEKQHELTFGRYMGLAIRSCLSEDTAFLEMKLKTQQAFANLSFNWAHRAAEWNALLTEIYKQFRHVEPDQLPKLFRENK